MRILSLEASNILRLTAAAVTVGDGTPIVTVSGQNGQGKSSLLNAIAMAIGGKKLCPPEPLKRGKDRGHVTVDLGAYRVTRKFWRNHAKDGELCSSLEVTSPDGATFKSPQALLDKLVSDLTFDPLAFLDLAPAAQREYVRAFVGLDFTALDADRRTALSHLATATSLLKMADRDVEAGDHYPDAPDAPVDVEALLAELADAERLAALAADAERSVEAKRRQYESTTRSLDALVDKIHALEAELDGLRREVRGLEEARTQERIDGTALRVEADAARAAVPDTAALRARLSDASVLNAQVTANVRHAAVVATQAQAREDVEAAKRLIAEIDVKKQAALEAAVFPVPGLAFSDEGLTFDGLPFEQASYAQQLRVAVAMGLANNPTLKVLLIKHGNALDSKSLSLLTELAEQAGAQVWIERVAEAADGVAIYIEDGRVGVAPPVARTRVERPAPADAPAVDLSQVPF